MAIQGSVEPLRRGIELGATFIDTAEAYGTEDVVGQAVAPIRDEVFIATKVSPSHSKYRDLLQAAAASLKRLAIERIDLYQLHWPSSSVPIEETMSAMDRLVAEGKVRFVGVSNFSVSQLREAQACSENVIVSNQVRYNLADRATERDLLPYCQEQGVSLIAYSPLAVGMRKLKAGLDGRVLEQVARARGLTQAQVAINWCISKAKVIAIPKSDSMARTEENCEASGWSLSPEEVRLLEDAGR